MVGFGMGLEAGLLVKNTNKGVVESLSGRSARDRNGKPGVRGRGAWTDLEWIARPEVSEGAAKKLFLSLRSLSG